LIAITEADQGFQLTTPEEAVKGHPYYLSCMVSKYDYKKQIVWERDAKPLPEGQKISKYFNFRLY